MFCNRYRVIGKVGILYHMYSFIYLFDVYLLRLAPEPENFSRMPITGFAGEGCMLTPGPVEKLTSCDLSV